MLVFFFLLASLPLFSPGETVRVDEASLIEALEDSPLFLEGEIGVHRATAIRKKIEDTFGWSMEMGFSNLNSNDVGLSNFEPIVRSRQVWETGLRKKTPHGIDLRVGGFASQHTNNFIENSTKTGLRLGLALDLYRDFLGRESKRKMRRANLEEKQRTMENEVHRWRVVNDLRKLYWGLVFNNESLRILGELLQQAERQLVLAERRKRDRVAESDEVSRYASLVTARGVQIQKLEYERENITEIIKEMIPELAEKTIRPGDYHIAQETAYYRQCAAVIKSSRNTPLQYTIYDEIVALEREQSEKNREYHETYNDADIKLVGEAEYFGKNFNYHESFDGFQREGRRTLSVGLTLTLPLGSAREDTIEILKVLENKREKARTSRLLSKIATLHKGMVHNLALLEKIDRNQAKNLTHAENILREYRRKYNQARISARDLIQEENAVLQIRLDTIETKTTAVNLMMDYLATFGHTPCHLNRWATK